MDNFYSFGIGCALAGAFYFFTPAPYFLTHSQAMPVADLLVLLTAIVVIAAIGVVLLKLIVKQAYGVKTLLIAQLPPAFMVLYQEGLSNPLAELHNVISLYSVTMAFSVLLAGLLLKPILEERSARETE